MLITQQNFFFKKGVIKLLLSEASLKVTAACFPFWIFNPKIAVFSS